MFYLNEQEPSERRGRVHQDLTAGNRMEGDSHPPLLETTAPAAVRDVTEPSWSRDGQAGILKALDKSLKTPSQHRANQVRQKADELASRGATEDAEDYYRQALQLDPLDYRTYLGLAHVLIRLRRLNEAHVLLRKSLAYAPRAVVEQALSDWRSYSLRLLGQIEADKGNYQDAVAALTKAVELSPGYAAGWYDLAVNYDLLGNGGAAGECLQTAIRLMPELAVLVRKESAFLKFRQGIEGPLTKLRSGVEAAIIDVETTAASLLQEADEADRLLSQLPKGAGPARSSRQQLAAILHEACEHLSSVRRVVKFTKYPELVEAHALLRTCGDQLGKARERVEAIGRESRRLFGVN